MRARDTLSLLPATTNKQICYKTASNTSESLRVGFAAALERRLDTHEYTRAIINELGYIKTSCSNRMGGTIVLVLATIVPLCTTPLPCPPPLSKSCTPLPPPSLLLLSSFYEQRRRCRLN